MIYLRILLFFFPLLLDRAKTRIRENLTTREKSYKNKIKQNRKTIIVRPAQFGITVHFDTIILISKMKNRAVYR